MSDLKKASAHFRKAETDLQEAIILLEAGHPEGTCNRAYYALFDGIITLLHTTDGPIPRTHTGAHTEFRKQFIRTGLFADAYSIMVSSLFNLRQGGDYEIDFDISVEDAKDAVEQASNFLEAVRLYGQQHKLY